MVYELKVSDVMKRDVITVGPETLMSELRTILRDTRISGTPVVENDKLVGIISIEDFIKWLIEGCEDIPVESRMSSTVKTAFSDEPLVHAISTGERENWQVS